MSEPGRWPTRRIVTRDDAFVGSLRAEGGRIVDVAPGGACARRGARLRRATGCCRGSSSCTPTCSSATPFRGPGVRWPEDAAVVAYDAQLASAGITTSFDSLAIGYVIDTGQRPRDPRPLAEAVRAAQARGLLRAEHFLHVRCEVWHGAGAGRLRAVRRRPAGAARLADGPHAGPATVRRASTSTASTTRASTG